MGSYLAFSRTQEASADAAGVRFLMSHTVTALREVWAGAHPRAR